MYWWYILYAIEFKRLLHISERTREVFKGMSKLCPLSGSYIHSTDCNECDRRRECKSGALAKMIESKSYAKKYRVCCVGVDQSYKRTGVSVSADGRLVKVSSVDLTKMPTKTEKRQAVQKLVLKALEASCKKADSTVLVMERIRTFSQQFLSVPYIKSMGAMNAAIVDAAAPFNVPCWSVDTRAWKSGVVGTSKAEENRLNADPHKWPTIKWLASNYPEFREGILVCESDRKKKGVFIADGKKWSFNDDACDSAAISQSWFLLDPGKFNAED